MAREFATEKRDDVFAPTTGAHSNNLLLVSFLQMADAAKNQGQSYKPTLASMDIGDAFLQVDQEHPVRCELQGMPVRDPEESSRTKVGSEIMVSLLQGLFAAELQL